MTNRGPACRQPRATKLNGACTSNIQHEATARLLRGGNGFCSLFKNKAVVWISQMQYPISRWS